MLRKPQKVQQAIEAQKEVKERKSRFQIMKLEERIAPRHADMHDPPCHYNPHGKLVGNC